MTISIEIFKGPEGAPYIPKLAQMRVKEFFNFPYLYVGNVEEDAQYSQYYSQTPQGLILCAVEENEMVGILSGLPFSAPVAFLKSWRNHAKAQGVDLSEAYYAGELIIEEAHRKKGLASQLMKHLEDEAKKMGYKNLAGITAIRAENHPLRPQNYSSADLVWPKLGFQKAPVTFSIDYPTRQIEGSALVEKNDMALWVREINLNNYIAIN
ncbi:GNAT family N-acetyltransferase [Candidatus Bealeia paramacronuclearis]|uniref:GNAT family N-acetyltransferase n=1 Tax=Candidatus Bealeia paramacronuclearis TaxID=1921001 RepID=A0ABZ2C6D9_9PROT|nr:GNAT family N-acetyltransferase [Candidatus Bealeia paramacronuclearis]